jgi:hypothetical protein
VPNGGDNLLFGDDLACPCDQHPENVEPARADRHWRINAAIVAPEQAAAAPIEAEIIEQENLGRRQGVHTPSPADRGRGRAPPVA